jgi:hypothetical protein
MQPAGVVALDHEDGLLPTPAVAPERLRRLLPVPLALVLS